jgi:hypothetical protein
MSAKGSSTFGAGLAFDSPFAFSAGGRAGAKNFGAPSNAGAEDGAFGVERAGAEAALAGAAFVTVGAVGGAVFAVATAGPVFRTVPACSALAAAPACCAVAAGTACSAFSGPGAGAGATGGAADGFTGPLEGVLSLKGTAFARLPGALAGTIGGGIPERG